MSASLVGSEMCIRDRPDAEHASAEYGVVRQDAVVPVLGGREGDLRSAAAVVPGVRPDGAVHHVPVARHVLLEHAAADVRADASDEETPLQLASE
eukprot:12985737-Alexandrium_andersonii.AAC.1